MIDTSKIGRKTTKKIEWEEDVADPFLCKECRELGYCKNAAAKYANKTKVKIKTTEQESILI